jgi:multimeric flavodoxin WrbA
MKIVVLNGSPKGDVSVTMQYVNFLAKKYPQAEFQTVNISQRIKLIEKNPSEFARIIADIQGADGVLWAFPLYILLVHAHYKRFIELIFERGAQAAFMGKYAATLSTSIHFFDHTAHNYMHAICDDLGMRYVDSFSPDMTDLLSPEGQTKTAQFGEHFLNAIQTQAVLPRQYAQLNWRNFPYEPGQPAAPVTTNGKKVVILHDSSDACNNLSRMVARCQAAFTGDVQVINLHDIEIKASCQGCLQCGGNNVCAFEGKDGFIDFFRSQIEAADILVYAGTITDRYFSSRWKMFFDRSFFNTHTPMLTGKQVVFLISGPFGQLENLREIFTAFTEYQMANLVGFASDEFGTSEEIDVMLDQLMARAAALAEQGYVRPATFLGVGGTKIFRDDIYGRLRIPFAADHRAYTRLGFYKTFPQRDVRTILLNTFAGPLLSIPRLRQGFNKMVKEQMVAPLKQVVDKA